MVYALDFETYYDKQVSVTTMGLYHYLHHPDCEIYMVAVYSKEAGFSYVGEPAAMDWSRLNGQICVAHNVRFDRACFRRLQELGVIPAGIEPRWECSADLVSALSYGRSLKAAVEGMYNITLSKDTRDNMQGVTWKQAMEKGMAEELASYCLKDAWYSYYLWKQLSPLWNDKERKLSALTRDMCDYGLHIDQALVEAGRQTLLQVMDSAIEKIPWADGYKPVLSPKHLKEECIKAGIQPPASLSQDSEECARWEEKYGSQFPWVAAMRDYRKANTLYKKLETLHSRIRPDGSFAYGLKYFGAHTGRFSGDAGFNCRNLPRVPMFGVDLRRMLIPRPGCGFITSDLAQIEQRVLSWLAGDNAMMEILATGVSPYEAHGRLTLGYSDPEPMKHKAPDLYRLAKARVLGLGFGAGAGIFVQLAKSMAGLDITPQQAQKIVADFRATNRLITALWATLERAMTASVGKDFSLPLPSGRKLYYRQVAVTSKGLSAMVQGKRVNFFGGKLAENLTSAVARDVLGEILLNLDAAGYRVVLHVHDEVVVEVPLEHLEREAKEVHRIMTTPPSWLAGLPLAAETTASTYYTK